jgi:divalent metal cation (Fe/Co/Zn/Cd) transporter
LPLQVLLSFGGLHVSQDHASDLGAGVKRLWVVGIMVAVTIVKLCLLLYCCSFKNEIVRAYAQDHFFDVITNSIGLVAAILAQYFYWWIDPGGAILVSFEPPVPPSQMIQKKIQYSN